MDHSKTQRQIIRKAVAFDLFHIIDQKPEKESYTPEEKDEIIKSLANDFQKSLED